MWLPRLLHIDQRNPAPLYRSLTESCIGCKDISDIRLQREARSAKSACLLEGNLAVQVLFPYSASVRVRASIARDIIPTGTLFT